MTLNYIMLTMTFLSLFTPHPLMMILILIIMVLTVSFHFLFLTKISWFSYLVILMVISGMLVMFSYMASLTPNEPKFFFKKKYLMLPLFVSIIFYYSSVKHYHMIYFPITSLSNFTLFMLFLVLYLLLLLFILMLMIPLNSGPLRSYV